MLKAIGIILVFVLLMPLCSQAFERKELSISNPSHMLYIFDAPTAYLLKEGETTLILAELMPFFSSLFSRWAWHVNRSVMGLGALGFEIESNETPQESLMFLYFHGFFGGRTKLFNTNHFYISTEEGIAGFYTNSDISDIQYYISLYITPILSIKTHSIGIHLSLRNDYTYLWERILPETEGGIINYKARSEFKLHNPEIGISYKLGQSTALLIEGKYQNNYTNLVLGVMVHKDLLRVKIGFEATIFEYKLTDFGPSLSLRGPM